MTVDFDFYGLAYEHSAGVQVCLPLPASPPASLSIEQCDILPVAYSTCPPPGADPRINVGPIPRSGFANPLCCGLVGPVQVTGGQACVTTYGLSSFALGQPVAPTGAPVPHFAAWLLAGLLIIVGAVQIGKRRRGVHVFGK
jgi:hypothetical protein